MIGAMRGCALGILLAMFFCLISTTSPEQAFKNWGRWLALFTQ